MEYIEVFKDISDDFSLKKLRISYGEEYAELMNDFMSDSDVAKFIQPYRLSLFLSNYTDWSRPEQEDCEKFLNKLYEWANVWIDTNGKDGNFTLLPRFRQTVRIYRDILTSAEQLDEKECFQKSIYLAFLIKNETPRNVVKQKRLSASSDFRKEFKETVKNSWEYLRLFLEKLIRKNLNIDPSSYFEKLSKCQFINFDAAFVWDKDSETNTYRGKSVEKCILWLDFSYEKSEDDFELIGINRQSLEERSIGYMIRTAINEAKNCYSHLPLQNKKSEHITIHRAFFQIGEYDQDYDGESIGCAVFCAALCRFLNRCMPSGVFYTGKIGYGDLTVEGVTEKARAGEEKQYTKFVIPADNYIPELEQIGIEIFRYRDSTELGNILINLLREPPDFLEIMKGSMDAIQNSFIEIAKRPYKKKKDSCEADIISLSKIGDFWNKNKTLNIGKYVSVKGTLSKYAPLLVGYPKDKIDIHRAYRRDIEPKLGIKTSKFEKDAYISYTAGQMVWKFEDYESSYIMLGLFGCIVRNSILLFVHRNYYYNTIEKLFEKGDNPFVIEACVTGRLETMPENFLKQLIDRIKPHLEIEQKVIEHSEKNTFILIIDDDDPITKVEYVGTPQYLDGDIWIAMEEFGKKSFAIRFLDIADYNDLQHEIQQLNNDAEGKKILYRFDQIKF